MNRITSRKNDSFSFNNRAVNKSCFRVKIKPQNPRHRSLSRISFPSNNLPSFKHESLVKIEKFSTKTPKKFNIFSTDKKVSSSINEKKYFLFGKPPIKLPILQYQNSESSPDSDQKQSTNDSQAKMCSIAIGTEEDVQLISLKEKVNKSKIIFEKDRFNIFEIFKSSATPQVYNSKPYKRIKRVIEV